MMCVIVIVINIRIVEKSIIFALSIPEAHSNKQTVTLSLSKL